MLSAPEIPTLPAVNLIRQPSSPQSQKPRLWKSVSTRIAVALLAGGLHAAGWLFPGAWYAAWLGQCALIALGVLCGPRGAFFYGWLCGAVGIGASFYWGIESLQLALDAPVAVAILIFCTLVAFEGVAFGAFCLIVSLARGGGPRAMWLLPFAWVAIEAWYPRLFPWQLAYSQLEVLELLQIAELVGSTGTGFVVTAVAAIPVLIAIGAWTNSKEERRNATCFSLAAIALLAMVLGHGYLRHRQWTAWTDKQPKFRIAMIQVDPAYVGSEEKLRERTLSICDQVDLICWPETSIGVYSEELSHFRDRELTTSLSRNSFRSLDPAKDLGRHLLAGGKLYPKSAGEDGPYAMTAFLISPEQEILGRYRKRTLLPFGEYVPGQSYYPDIRKWATLTDIMEAGNDPSPLVTRDGRRLGVLICYEDTFPANARQTVVAGAEALFSLIQGSAFENPLTLVQHQRLAALRAVENRRYFVRCSSTGVTCVIAPTGKIVAQLQPQTDGTLLGEIVMIDHRSVYNIIGEVFPWFCTAVTALGLYFSLRGRRLSPPRAT